MGCTHSSRASTQPAPRQFSSDSPSSNPVTANVRPNAPIRQPRPVTDANTPRTRSALESERAVFFHTRVTGRAEVWAAIRAAIELLRDEQDFATAQSVLDAAGVTVPSGRLEEGMFDENGQLYSVENWILADPDNLAEDNLESGVLEEVLDDKVAPSQVKLGTSATDQTASSPHIVQVRLRLSDSGGRDVLVLIDKNETVQSLRDSLREQAGISTSAAIRLFHLGKMLDDHASIASSGWREGDCISALISSIFPAPL